jgi:hypothetical protein
MILYRQHAKAKNDVQNICHERHPGGGKAPDREPEFVADSA